MSFESADEMTAKLEQQNPDGTFSYELYVQIRPRRGFFYVDPLHRDPIDGDFPITWGWGYEEVLAEGIFLWQNSCYNEKLKMIFVSWVPSARALRDREMNTQSGQLGLRM